MNYYRSEQTNLIVSGNFIKALDYVHGKGTVNKLIEDGVLKEIEDPSVEDCILHGSGSVAVLRYRELHPDISWDDARIEVRKIQKEIRNSQKKNKEPKTPVDTLNEE